MNNIEKRKLAFRCTGIGAIVDLLLGAAKVFVGLVYGSHALVSDGIHSFSDLFTDGFVLVIAKISTEAPDEDHPYGHGRFETIGSVGMGILIFLVGVFLAIDNVSLILNPPKEFTRPGGITLIIAALSIFLKEVIFQYTKRVAHKIESQLLLANAWHSRSDALSSIIVFIGLILSMLGLNFADYFVAVIVSFFIGKVGLDFVFKGISELVDSSVPKEKIKEFENEILKCPSINSIHNFRSRKIGHQMIFDINIEVDSFISVSEGHEVANWVVHTLKEMDSKVMDVTVHIDVENDHPVDEKGNLITLGPLPLKNEITTRLKTKLGNELFDYINEFQVHYVGREVQLDIFLISANIDKKELIDKTLKTVELFKHIRYFSVID